MPSSCLGFVRDRRGLLVLEKKETKPVHVSNVRCGCWGDGIQQMWWDTARETRPGYGPSMLELASCMKWGVCNEGGRGRTDELVAVAAQEK